MKYPDNILEVSSLYQIIWDLSFGKIIAVFWWYHPYSTRIDKKVGVLLMKHPIIIQKY
jgi:hypothetical protein